MGRGKRQRLSDVADAAVSTQSSSSSGGNIIKDSLDSELCRFLVKLLSWGLMSACRVQEIAHAAYQDEQRLVQSMCTSSAGAMASVHGSTSLKRFAALGSFGRCPGTCFRVLRLYLGEPC